MLVCHPDYVTLHVTNYDSADELGIEPVDCCEQIVFSMAQVASTYKVTQHISKGMHRNGRPRTLLVQKCIWDMIVRRHTSSLSTGQQ